MSIEDVIREDKRLDAAEEACTLALMHHRWHWTLDDSNPERIALRDYALARGLGHTTIHQYAQGYVIYQEAVRLQPNSNMTPGEARHRARMSAERQMAVEAVADAAGVSFVSASARKLPQVRDALALASEQAAARGTTPQQEIVSAAQTVLTAEAINRQAGTDLNVRQAQRVAQVSQDWQVPLARAAEERDWDHKTIGQKAAELDRADLSDAQKQAILQTDEPVTWDGQGRPALSGAAVIESVQSARPDPDWSLWNATKGHLFQIQARGTDAIIAALDARELERDEKYLPGFIDTLRELAEKISARRARPISIVN